MLGEEVGCAGQIQVLVAGRSHAFAEGVAALLTSADITARAVELDCLASGPESEHARVLVLDGDSVEMLGHESLESMRQRCPGSQLLLLMKDTPYGCDQIATAAGAAAWLSSDSGPRMLIDAVLALHDHRSISQSRARRAQRGPNDALLARLTDRELAVLELLGQALSNESITRVLGISTHTVRTHIRNVLMKFNVHSRAEAVAIAARTGFLNGRSPAHEEAASAS
jgi:DNA-binding NarL/FixJ family response regulator